MNTINYADISIASKTEPCVRSSMFISTYFLGTDSIFHQNFTITFSASSLIKNANSKLVHIPSFIYLFCFVKIYHINKICMFSEDTSSEQR